MFTPPGSGIDRSEGGSFLSLASWVEEAAEYWKPSHLVLSWFSCMLKLHRFDDLFAS